MNRAFANFACTGGRRDVRLVNATTTTEQKLNRGRQKPESTGPDGVIVNYPENRITGAGEETLDHRKNVNISCNTMAKKSLIA